MQYFGESDGKDFHLREIQKRRVEPVKQIIFVPRHRQILRVPKIHRCRGCKRYQKLFNISFRSGKQYPILNLYRLLQVEYLYTSLLVDNAGDSFETTEVMRN